MASSWTRSAAREPGSSGSSIVEFRGVTGGSVAPTQGLHSWLMVRSALDTRKSILALGLGRMTLVGRRGQSLGDPNQPGAEIGFRPHAPGWARAGRTNWNVAPAPALREAHKRPRWASMIDRLIESPMPIPPGLVVKNASNRRDEWSGSNPTPASSTATRTESAAYGCDR